MTLKPNKPPLPFVKSLIGLSLFFSGVSHAIDCTNIENWKTTVAYLKGHQIQYNSVAYTSNWWTQNHNPKDFSGPFEEWAKVAACTTSNASPQVSLNSPANGSLFAVNETVSIEATASDSDGAVNQVEFKVGGNSIGIDTSAPFTLDWLSTAGTFTVEAIATDNQGASAIDSANITVSNGNLPPAVNLTNPTHASQVKTGDLITLSADANDSDGRVSSVEFFADDVLVGSAQSAPYQGTWVATAGHHSFKAKATDDDNAETFSSVVNLTVSDTQAGGGCAGIPVYVAGAVYGANDIIENVNHRYQCNISGWCSSPAGWAYEPGVGEHWQSAWVDLGTCGEPPVLSITSPADNQVILSGASVSFSADVSDTDGSVSQVEFFVNGSSLSVDTSAPYSTIWTASTSGNAQLKAVATDNQGKTSENTILVNVSNKPIAVSLTSPTAGSTARLGNSVSLTATSSSLVGSVSQVAFRVNGSTVATDTAKPYSVSWTPAATGSYTITAQATDSNNNQATSSAATVSVTDTPFGDKHKLIGYWHNFTNGAGCPIRLGNISSKWDVIDIAFADNDSSSNGTVHFNLFDGAGSQCAAINPVQFKQDIAALQAQGKVVVLSLGGAEGTITLNTASDEANFVNSLTAIINEWGFDGVDIDLESGSNLVHGSQIQSRLPNALKQIETNIGGNLYLTMAPEHPYVHGGIVAYSGIWGAYIPIINELRDTLDLLHVQLYNNSGLSNPYSGSPAFEGSVDMMVASVRMLVEGFTLANGERFAPLRDDQVAIGLPSGSSSANTGQASTQNIIDALDCIKLGTSCGSIPLNAQYPNIGGVMTWSINWDAHDGFNFSGPIGDKIDAMNAN